MLFDINNFNFSFEEKEELRNIKKSVIAGEKLVGPDSDLHFDGWLFEQNDTDKVSKFIKRLNVEKYINEELVKFHATDGEPVLVMFEKNDNELTLYYPKEYKDKLPSLRDLLRHEDLGHLWIVDKWSQ